MRLKIALIHFIFVAAAMGYAAYLLKTIGGY